MVDFTRLVSSAFNKFGTDADFCERAKLNLKRVRVILHWEQSEVETFGVNIRESSVLIDVKKSDVSHPQKGDEFIICGQSYTINSAPYYQDTDRLIWRCPAAEE